MDFCLNDCVGLTVDEATALLAAHGVNDVAVVANFDRKQNNFDKELVTAVRQRGQTTELVVCRYLFTMQ